MAAVRGSAKTLASQLGDGYPICVRMATKAAGAIPSLESA